MKKKKGKQYNTKRTNEFSTVMNKYLQASKKYAQACKECEEIREHMLYWCHKLQKISTDTCIKHQARQRQSQTALEKKISKSDMALS